MIRLSCSAEKYLRPASIEINLVLGKFFNLRVSHLLLLSFWWEGQIADSFLSFAIAWSMVSCWARLRLLWVSEWLFSFFDSCDTFWSIAVKVCWDFFQSLLSRLIVSCEAFSIGIGEATAWVWRGVMVNSVQMGYPPKQLPYHRWTG